MYYLHVHARNVVTNLPDDTLGHILNVVRFGAVLYRLRVRMKKQARNSN